MDNSYKKLRQKFINKLVKENMKTVNSIKNFDCLDKKTMLKFGRERVKLYWTIVDCFIDSWKSKLITIKDDDYEKIKNIILNNLGEYFNYGKRN